MYNILMILNEMSIEITRRHQSIVVLMNESRLLTLTISNRLLLVLYKIARNFPEIYRFYKNERKLTQTVNFTVSKVDPNVDTAPRVVPRSLQEIIFIADERSRVK